MAKTKTKRTKEAAPEADLPPLRLEWLSPAELAENPRNWKDHPEAQLHNLRDVLKEVGWAGACLYNERTKRLIDGHARRKLAMEQGSEKVPVLVGSWTEEQEKVILATFDPLAAMAQADDAKLEALLAEVRKESPAMLQVCIDVAEQCQQIVASVQPLPELGGGREEENGIEEDAEEDAFDLLFKSPYPWFGGKSRVAGKVWSRFGDVKGYIEPFFGSGAVFLNRPQPFDGVETINDFDALVSNFWRAVQAAPDDVAKWCDWPVNENDLTARHAWLVARKDALTAKLEGDPDYFDAKIAGWWCWGMSLWIGGGFCEGKGPWQIVEGEDGSRQLVHLGNEGRGINRKLVHLGDEGRGVNRKLVHLSDEGRAGLGERGLKAWMQALSERLRRVRVCCGDWKRVCGGNSGDALHHFFVDGEPCGIFLDPPYADTADREDNLYRCDSLQVAHAVREWAIAYGNDPRLRIALCGYEGEHQMPPNWECVKWKAPGGMAGISKDDDTRGKQNAFRERLWFSPHCLKV